MALFNDGPINQQQDLANYENSVLDLANQEQIDLDGKLALAQREIGTSLLALLLRQETRSPFTNWIDPQDVLRRSIGVSDVVVTDPLQQWHALKTLATVYRDAYNNQLNDRYLKKWDEYLRLELDARIMLYQIGVGISGYWLPQASQPSLSITVGTGAAAQYFVQVTWVNQLTQESAPSVPASISSEPGTTLVVVPPSSFPRYATGWNVYASASPGAETLQNTQPNALGQSWTLPATGLAAGNPLGTGQAPDYYVIDDHLIPRG